MSKPKLITVILHKQAIREGLEQGVFQQDGVLPICMEAVKAKVEAFLAQVPAAKPTE